MSKKNKVNFGATDDENGSHAGPASAGADHGSEVGGAQQGVLGSAHTAPVIDQRSFNMFGVTCFGLNRKHLSPSFPLSPLLNERHSEPTSITLAFV